MHSYGVRDVEQLLGLSRATIRALKNAGARGASGEERVYPGGGLGGDDSRAAQRADESAVAADPAHLDARINLGRLLPEAGRLAKAEQVYRDALKAGSRDPVLLFNL